MADDRHTREHSIEVVAADADIDELGHVSNLVYVRWVQEIAIVHSRAAGFDTAEYMKLGAVFVVRKHEIEYLAPAYRGEKITLTTWVEGWSAATSIRKTRITRDGRELVRATTTWAFVSTESGRPKRIPKEIADAFYSA